MKALRLLIIGALAVVPVAAQEATAGDARAATDCTATSTNLVPLTDLGRRKYKAHPGGLYPGGLNRPPRPYLAAGLAASRRVRAVNGRIVLLSIGMSNTTQEFRAFMRLASQDPEISPNVVLVDGAIGGWDARRIARPDAAYWSAVDRRLQKAGASPREVQAVWLKEAISGEERPFPQDARALQRNLRAISRILSRRFPNLRLIYTSSRTFGGYALVSLNPEPAAYDSGYGVRWLIQDRIENRLRSPWIGWGPYLWTDGVKGRLDGLTWTCDDVMVDGTHPSESGSGKVARLLLRFFKTDPTASPWFAPAP
jgi:hypothetical protein